MKFNRSIIIRAVVVVSLTTSLTALSSRLQAATGNCGGTTVTIPFTDVPASNIFFCSIASAFFTGLTNGTTPTTYNPNDPVPREQMAAFVSRTLEQSIKRTNQRAALGEWWTQQADSFPTIFGSFTSTDGHNPRFMACDGQTIWVSNTEADTVVRIDPITAKLICTLDVPSPQQIVIVGGRLFIASAQTPGTVYSIRLQDITSTGAPNIYTGFGNNPVGITYDGINLWTANDGTGPGTGSITRKPMVVNEPVVTFSAGFSQPRGVVFDGANLWVTDAGDASLKRVDRNSGAVLQTIPLGGAVQHPIFDGANLWIPCQGSPDKVFVVRGSGGLMGTVLATLTGNGLSGPFQAAFDGERICVTNASARSVSLWKATDLTPIASVNVVSNTTVYNPRGICSDGTFFYIGLRSQAGAVGAVCRL